MTDTARLPKPKPGPLDYLARWPLRLWVAGTALFLYAPLITLMVFSFNNSRRNIVWRGFTLDYYAQVLQDESLQHAFVNSLTIALVSTLLSVILGAATALLLWRFRFPFKPGLEGALSIPIVVPEICMGVAFLVFFTKVVPWTWGPSSSPTCPSRSASWPAWSAPASPPSTARWRRPPGTWGPANGGP